MQIPAIAQRRTQRLSGGQIWQDDSYQWVLTNREWFTLRGRLELLEPDEVVVIDLETTGKEETGAYSATASDGFPTSITLAAITIGHKHDDAQRGTWVVPLQHRDSPFRGQRWKVIAQDIAKILMDRRVPLVNHNLRYDLLWLWRFTGHDLVDMLWWDTLTASHLLDENRSNRLKDVVPAMHGEVGNWADVDLSRGAHNTDLFALGHYAARDTYWTHWLWRQQLRMFGPDINWAHEMRREAISPDERDDARLALHFHTVAMPEERALHVAERTGFPISPDAVDEMIASRTVDEAEAYQHIRESDLELFEQAEANDDVYVSLAPTSLFWQSLTERAVARGALEVTAWTKSGNPQWNKHVLNQQARDGSDLAQRVLDWRDATKAMEFLSAWPGFISPADNRIHPSYRSTSTVTGRTSCAAPNLQQVNKDLKRVFRASPGWRVVEIDYSQIELRVAAHVANCRPMIEAYIRGDDLHTIMAAMVSGLPMSQITPVIRQRGKAGNFGFLYGMMPAGFVIYASQVYGVEFTLEEATDFRETYFRTWDGLAEWHARFERIAMRQGYVTSPLGRIRRVPMALYGDDYQAGEAVRQAINSPIQSMASDMLQIAAAMVAGVPLHDSQQRTPIPQVRLLGSVHDSLVLEVREDVVSERVDDVLRTMVYAVPRYLRANLGIDLKVPLAAEAEIGPAWGVADEVLEMVDTSYT